MTGQKKIHRKVTGKEHWRLTPKKLDLTKEKEEVKFLGGLVAEMMAVQAELTQGMENSLLNPERSPNPNPEGLRITAQQLRQVNLLGAQLNATVEDYLDGLLDALDQADQGKAN